MIKALTKKKKKQKAAHEEHEVCTKITKKGIPCQKRKIMLKNMFPSCCYFATKLFRNGFLSWTSCILRDLRDEKKRSHPEDILLVPSMHEPVFRLNQTNFLIFGLQ
jgi:hypothetical protein